MTADTDNAGPGATHERLALSVRESWVIGAMIVGTLAGCSPIKPTSSPLGGWGGDHAQLTVSATGATVQFECAYGSLDQMLGPDSRGRFDVPGTLVKEHGGPVAGGEMPDRHPARYSGVIEGQTMTLTVTTTDQPETIGPFTLVQGAQTRMVRCL